MCKFNSFHICQFIINRFIIFNDGRPDVPEQLTRPAYQNIFRAKCYQCYTRDNIFQLLTCDRRQELIFFESINTVREVHVFSLFVNIYQFAYITHTVLNYYRDPFFFFRKKFGTVYSHSKPTI